MSYKRVTILTNRKQWRTQKAKKDQFIVSAEKEIEEINEKIEKLDKKIEDNSNEVERETKEALQSLKDEKEELHQELSELENASKENWERLTASIEEGFEDLKRGYNSLLEDMKTS